MIKFFLKLFYGVERSLHLRGAKVVSNFTSAADALRKLNEEIRLERAAKTDLVQKLLEEEKQLADLESKQGNFINNIEKLFTANENV